VPGVENPVHHDACDDREWVDGRPDWALVTPRTRAPPDSNTGRRVEATEVQSIGLFPIHEKARFMSSVFAKAVNDFETTTAGHAAGASTLALQPGDGARLGSLPAGRVYRVTAVLNPGTKGDVILGIFEATGITGDTLTGVSAVEGFANVALSDGVTIELRVTARFLSELQDAVNASEAAIAANTSAIAAKAADDSVVHTTGDETVGGIKTFTSPIAGTITGNIAEGQVTGLVSDLGALATAIAGKQAADADLTAIAALGHAKGQLIVDAGSGWVALAPGSDTQVLTADSAQADGVKWAAAAGGGSPGGSSGDLQINDGSGGLAGGGPRWDGGSNQFFVPGAFYGSSNNTLINDSFGLTTNLPVQVASSSPYLWSSSYAGALLTPASAATRPRS